MRKVGWTLSLAAVGASDEDVKSGSLRQLLPHRGARRRRQSALSTHEDPNPDIVPTIAKLAGGYCVIAICLVSSHSVRVNCSEKKDGRLTVSQ